MTEQHPSVDFHSLSTLKKSSSAFLYRYYKSLYHNEPKQLDRGFLIRHIYCHFHQNKTEAIQRPPVTELDLTQKFFTSNHPSKLSHFNLPYRTASGTYLWLSCETFYFKRSELPLMSDYQRFASCGNCKGSGGGCPTYSPSITQLKPSCKYVYLIVLSCDFKWVFKNVWKDRRNNYKNATLMFLMYPDRITDNYLSRVTKAIRKEHNLGYNLLCGNCEGCRPKYCTVNQRNSYCSFPSKRTFSIESAGVDCDALHYDLYGHWMPWFFARTDKMPLYISRYTCFLTNKSPTECDDVLLPTMQADKSYDLSIPTDYVDPDISLTTQTIPVWNHVNELQPAYQTDK